MTDARPMVTVAIAVLFTFATGRAEEKPAEQKLSEPDKAILAALETEIEILAIKGHGLGDVFDYLREISGANVFVNWNSLKSAGVNPDVPVVLDGQKISLRAALNKILADVEKQKGSLQFAVENGVIVISASPDPKNPVTVTVTGGAAEKLDRRLPELPFSGQAFSDVINFMKDVTGLKLVVDWDALKKAGIEKSTPVRVRVKEVSISESISLILQSVSDGKTSLQCTFKNGVGTITTAPKADK